MGYNMDALASYLAAKRPLELIHRTAKRDYAYTRGVNKGSFSEGLQAYAKNTADIAQLQTVVGTIERAVIRIEVMSEMDLRNRGMRPPPRLLPDGGQ